jgi:hypothetical protein
MTVFVGGEDGSWAITRLEPVTGPPLEPASRLDVREENDGGNGVWAIRGTPSYERYVNAAEQRRLADRSPPLGRPEASLAAMIPIKKSDEWWALPQDERRGIFEERSHHIATGLEYLPAIARRLYHCRDLGEPFDFVTWFEYAPEDAAAFEELVDALRLTEEWNFVEREVDLRLERR